jgi:Pectate lyase superfamily protein
MTTLIPKFDLKNGGSTPTGAINRTIYEKLSDVISVKDFGAVGDGTTDDTAVIQYALAQGKTVLFPAGTYAVTGVKVSSQSVISIVGENATIYLKNASNAPTLWFDTCVSVSVDGLTIDGNKANQTISSSRLNGVALRLDAVTTARIINNTIQNTSTGAAITLGSVDPFAVDNTTESAFVDSNIIKNCGSASAAYTCDGIYCQLDNAIITNNKINTGTDYGIALEYSHRSVVSSNMIDTVETGMGGVGVDTCVFSDNTLTNCLFAGIALTTAGQAVTAPWISYRTIIANNNVNGVGGSSLPGNKNAIVVSYSNVQTDFTVCNNKVTGGDYGIVIATNGVLVHGNYAKGSLIRGILSDSNAYTTFYDNVSDSTAAPDYITALAGEINNTYNSNIQKRVFRQTTTYPAYARFCYIKTSDVTSKKNCVLNLTATGIHAAQGPVAVYAQVQVKSVAGTVTVTDIIAATGDTAYLTIGVSSSGSGVAEVLGRPSSGAMDINLLVDLVSMDSTSPFYIKEV